MTINGITPHPVAGPGPSAPVSSGPSPSTPIAGPTPSPSGPCIPESPNPYGSGLMQRLVAPQVLSWQVFRAQLRAIR